jgi:hypothetical protein
MRKIISMLKSINTNDKGAKLHHSGVTSVLMLNAPD